MAWTPETNIKGPPGPAGPPGADSTVPGPRDTAGATGPAGATGADSTVPGPQGPPGATGSQGPPGATGATGPGVAPGGTTGQVLTKVDATDYNTNWQTPPPAGAVLPPGMVGYFAMTTVPTGWLKANGAPVSRTTYADLFAAIGTLYGAGDGTTTFNIPDLRGEFVRGFDDGRGVDAGRVLGSAQASDNLSHDHVASTNTTGAHTHVMERFASSAGPGSGRLVPDGSGSNRSTESAGNHSHTVTVNTSGGTEARPRNVALLACVKT